MVRDILELFALDRCCSQSVCERVCMRVRARTYLLLSLHHSLFYDDDSFAGEQNIYLCFDVCI